ncbi:MAG: ATP-binding protein [Armatimonadetes bacterium]|nr:ATP-binding protein [Armatimonadota bacterium]
MRELALHFLDLLRNSVEAGARIVELDVAEETASGLLRFELRDDGRGMDETTLARATDPFFTSRTTRRVGMGLALMRACCERCGGELSVASQPGQGTVVTGHLLVSHLDCPPLGDMGAVAQSMACEADAVEFVYRHRVDRKVFSLDTRRIKAKLGMHTLGAAEVLSWIREHVNEELRRLHRGRRTASGG